MGNGFWSRAARGVFVVALVSAPFAIASVAFADGPSVESTATVANGAELRTQWAIGANTLITLTHDIDLGDDGSGGDACGKSEPCATRPTPTRRSRSTARASTASRRRVKTSACCATTPVVRPSPSPV